MPHRIRVWKGDITTLAVDAIVNAAKRTLLGGGGVDGAIHAAAGPGLLEECRELKGCETGDAKITGGHNLPAKHVIHAVGPIYRAGDPLCPVLLASCYRRSLHLARKHKLVSIAFPAISTGIYGYPLEDACAIAVAEISRFLATDEPIEEVVLVGFDEKTCEVYRRLLG